MGDYNYDEINEWLEEHKRDIINPFSEAFDKTSSDYEYYNLSSDEDDIEIWDIYDSKNHLCGVTAKVVVEVGDLKKDQDGDLWPDVSRGKGDLHFYVDIDDEGDYSISFDVDNEGKIDVNAAFSPEEPDYERSL